MASVESLFEDGHRKGGRPFDLTLIGPWSDDEVQCPPAGELPAPPSHVPAVVGLSLDEAYRRYLNDPTRAWSPSTREAYETSRKLANSVMGAKTPIAAVSRSQCRELLDVVRTLPVNAAKRCSQLSRGIEAAKARGDVYKGRPATIRPDDVRELHQQGMGATAIAKKLKIGRASVYRALAT